jgi:hypothetical protein
MLEIPREVSAAEVDRPKMAPGEAASGEASVAAFGAEMEQTSFYGARQELVLQGAQDRVDASAVKSQIEDELETKAEAYQTKPDYWNYQKYAAQDIEDLKKTIGENERIKDNPRLQSIISPYLEERGTHFKHVINAKYLGDLQKDGVVKLGGELNQLMHEASQFPAGKDRDDKFEEMDMVARDFQLSHLINPETVNKMLEGREKNVQESYITSKIGSQKPDEIKQGLDLLKGNNKDTDKIDPEKKAIMTEKGEDRLEKVQNKVDNNNAMNVALGLIQSNHGDADLALAEFDKNIELQKQMGANTYQKTRQLLRDHIEDTKEKQEHESGNISKDIMDKIKSGKLGEALHALDQNRDKMTKSDYEVMSNAITSEKKYLRMERREVDRDAREKRRDKGDEIFGTLMTALMSGKKLNSVHDIYSQVPKGLSAEHANMLAAINDGKKDADFKLGTDVINDAFNNKILDATQRGKAMIDLQARQAKENLSGKALIDAANEIVHPHVEHWYNNLLDKVAGQGTKENQPAPIKSKSGKDMWKWPDGSFHYSPPPEKQ